MCEAFSPDVFARHAVLLLGPIFVLQMLPEVVRHGGLRTNQRKLLTRAGRGICCVGKRYARS